MTIMKSSIGITKIGFLLIFLLALSFAIVACEPLITIRIHNQTDEILEIFIDGEVSIGMALPGDEVVWNTSGIFPDYTITAKDLDGNTAYILTWTRADMKGKDKYDVYLPPLRKGIENSGNTTESDNITGR